MVDPTWSNRKSCTYHKQGNLQTIDLYILREWLCIFKDPYKFLFFGKAVQLSDWMIIQMKRASYFCLGYPINDLLDDKLLAMWTLN